MLNKAKKIPYILTNIALLLVIASVVQPVSAEEATSSAKQPCLLKYDTLSSIMCETSQKDVLGLSIGAKEASSGATTATDSAKTQEKKEEFIREVKGIKKEYIYTDRVAKGDGFYYTKLREKPEEKSKRLETVKPSDKVRIIKTDKKGWYFVQIFKSEDKDRIGKEGWIERWLIDNENVPVEPTATPTPSASPSKEGNATDSATPVTSSSEGEALYSMVNTYRTSNGLPAFEKSERLCSIARERAPEIAGEVATGSVHAGFAARGYGYPVAVENAVGMGSVEANFNWWVNSGLHRGSILGPDLKYSCVECKDGNCVQLFSPNP